jgi:phosphoglycerol transferase MdoB-like AlkP superfamily enzyme
MFSQRLKSGAKNIGMILLRLQRFLAPRAYSVIMLGALFCTLAVKLFHSWRYSLLDEYPAWIMADLSVLLAIEVILSLVCFHWPRKAVVRLATIIAAVVCTWSVMNAGWLIRTGTQILPRVLLSLIRAPVSSLYIVVVNLIEMPTAALALIVPSAIAITFFVLVLARPKLPVYNRRRFIARVIFSLAIVVIAVVVRPAFAQHSSSQIGSAGLRYNSQLRAVVSLVLADYRKLPEAKRKIPTLEMLNVNLKQQRAKHNILLVVLEGVQYRYTSLTDSGCNLTPYLASLAEQGIEFSNARSTLTHTTKALFALMTGRFASASQDIAETVPAESPYASIASILGSKLGYRTAFFQSAMGSFESRPGLVNNLGYDYFWAREDSNDPNSFLGYLACDEFSMLEPIKEWIESGERPFFLTIMCSVTHDPYEVPQWFGTPAKEPLEKYQQSISYTDKFLAALGVELESLGIADRTIFCIIGDHGEGFGEHGLLGHERIAFDEVLRIPFCLRIPFSVRTGIKISKPASSIDLAPTLLGLLGFDTESMGFDGLDLLQDEPKQRKLYFSGWMQEGPAGYVEGNLKFIYNPTNKTSCAYDLAVDPEERNRIELSKQDADKIAQEIINWRKNTVFKIDQQRTGRKELYDKWICRWTDRVSSTKRIKK